MRIFAMMHRIPAEKMIEIEQLTLLAEETLAQLQNRIEELKAIYRKHQGVLPNPALSIGPSNPKQLQR